ncbi:MAG: hypothetical protein R2718_02250 [Solirubrobacterales bacterium]|nr:hypothetical protein [Solirubrobacterales bacterium]
MTAAASQRRRRHQRRRGREPASTGPGRSRSLEDVVVGALGDLRSTGVAGCPVCGGRSLQADGCVACGSALS